MSYLGEDIFQDYRKMIKLYGGVGHGKFHANSILKGKKMSQIYEVVAIQEYTNTNPEPTIVVPITTVVAKDNQTAVQNFLIENAEALKGKENLQTLCRPFC